MYDIKGVVTQTGADTATEVVIDTNLTPDGKAGWTITGIEAFWRNGYLAAAGDQLLSLKVATETGSFAFSDDELIVQQSWAVANTSGVAVAYPVDLVAKQTKDNPRLTVQPLLYVRVESAGTGLTNVVDFIIHYEVTKLTDLEVLRLLQGGV